MKTPLLAIDRLLFLHHQPALLGRDAIGEANGLNDLLVGFPDRHLLVGGFAIAVEAAPV
jgi:hypothetical protein